MRWKTSKDILKNELKLNLPTTIFLSYPEISYERVIDSDISVGASLGFTLDPDLFYYYYQYSFIPYVRWFFGGNTKNLQKYGTGFFIEANGAILGSNGVGTGLGLALGWKYLTQNNWIGEIYLGGGHDFVVDGVYPRIGISIGKRF